MLSNTNKGLTYADAGVDIDAGNKAVELMKDSVKATYRPEVLGDLGGFGGLFSLMDSDIKKPILVSGTDGVGTKLRLAILMDKHDTVGQDCVAMSINDVLVQGAEPLFFLDYIAVGKLDPVQVASIVKGVANACKESGCALLGGETAEMAGFYAKDDYDLAGFGVGIVDRDKVITGETIKAGDVLIGLPSTGVHSNGFSLVRKIVFERQQMKLDQYVDELGMTIGECLLTPTRLYPRPCLPIIKTLPSRAWSTSPAAVSMKIFPASCQKASASISTSRRGRSCRFSRSSRSGAASMRKKCTVPLTWVSA